MKKLFTLIELIVVVIVLGILAAIVMPNISSMKEESLSAMVGSNIQSIQTSSDMYHLKEGNYATVKESSITKPRYVDMTAIVPNYLKKEPDESKISQYYWIDYFGKVWGSTVDAPRNFQKNDEFIEFAHVEKAVSYRVYSIKDNLSSNETIKYSLVGEYLVEGKTDMVQLEIKHDRDRILISSVDRFGYESAPVGLSYSSPHNDWFSPILSKTGEFTFEIESKDTMIWDAFSSSFDKPEGSDIKFEFSILQDDGTFSPYTTEFGSLMPSKHIKAKVIMSATGPKNPSLYEMNIFYHFGKGVVKGPIVSNDKLPDGKTVVIEEIQIPTEQKVISIENNSSKPETTETTTTIKVREGVSWKEVDLYTDIPTGSIIRVETTYSEGEVQHQPTVVTVKKEPAVAQPKLNAPVNPAPPNSPETTVEEWETIQTLNFAAHSGSSEKADWISVIPTHSIPETTRIVYTYSTSNSTSYADWTGNYKESQIDLVPDSRSLRVTATLQVLKEKLGTVANPEVKSIKILSEKGELTVTDLSTYNPQEDIKWQGFTPILFDGNPNNYFTFPQGENIYEISWFGDISGRTMEVKSSQSLGDYVKHSFVDSQGNKIATIDAVTKTKGTDFSPMNDGFNRLLVPKNAVKLKIETGRFSFYNSNIHEVRVLPKSEQKVEESIVSVIPSITNPEVDFIFQKPSTEIGHVIIQNGKKPTNLERVSDYAQKDSKLYTNMDYEYDIYITSILGEFLNIEPIKKTIRTPKSPSGVELRGLPAYIFQPFNSNHYYQLSSQTEEVSWVGNAAGKKVTFRSGSYGDKIVIQLLDAGGKETPFLTGENEIILSENTTVSTTFTMPNDAKSITIRKQNPASNNGSYTARIHSIIISN